MSEPTIKAYFDLPGEGADGPPARVSIDTTGRVRVDGLPSFAARPILDGLQWCQRMSRYGPADGDPDLAFLGDMAKHYDSTMVVRQMPQTTDRDGQQIVF